MSSAMGEAAATTVVELVSGFRVAAVTLLLAPAL